MDVSLVEDKIIVEEEPLIAKLAQRGFGTTAGKKLQLSLIEGLFLIERESLKVNKDGKKVSREDILGIVKKEDFLLRYRVYSDLRERGYIVKTGFKYGAHFRVYERGAYPSEHAKFLVHAVPESHSLSFSEVARAVRLAQGVKKVMMFAVVDDEGDITYYIVDRVTP